MACPHATGSGTLSRLFCQMPSTLPLCIHTTLPGYQPFQYKVVASSPWDKGGGASLKQKNFSALQASAGAKKRGGQATLLDLPLLAHLETILEVIKIFVQFHCLSSYHRIKMPCIETTGYPLSFLQSCLGEDAVEPWYNGVSKEGENIFATMRFCYIKVLFHKFYYYWGKENCSLYRGLP